MYKENLRHILKHKWFVMLECFKVGLFWHGITHDISKLLPSEFIGYSENFFSDKFELRRIAEELPFGALSEDKFKKAWLLHQHRNKHHWDYWVNSDGKPIPMPLKNVRQMVCDWKAMSQQLGGTALEFYHTPKKRDGMKLHHLTVELIEGLL